MSEPTKACSLTRYEIKALIGRHADALIEVISHDADIEEGIERINYLNKRLKSFNEVEIVKEETKTEFKPEPIDKVGW